MGIYAVTALAGDFYFQWILNTGFTCDVHISSIVARIRGIDPLFWLWHNLSNTPDNTGDDGDEYAQSKLTANPGWWEPGQPIGLKIPPELRPEHDQSR
jgi:hypothetical protein